MYCIVKDYIAMSDIKFTGSCECGHCTYTCTTLPQSSGFCHCITCQKLAGSSSMPFAPVPTDSLTWTNEPVVLKRSDVATRLGCEKCHSWLLMRYKSTPERTSLNVPSVDFGMLSSEDVKKFAPTHHIFVAQKAPWMQIHDDLPQYERFRGDSHRVET